MAEGAADPLQAGAAPGATHEKPKAERPAFSGNYRSSPTLTGAAVLQPKHATAGQAQLPERSHASPLPARRSREKGRSGRRRRLAGAPGRGTLEKDKPPILGLIQRGGQLVIRMLANVQQQTIQPVITATVTPDSLIHTDEYDIYARLPAWGYRHKTVCHSRGEYARDEDGDGFCEVHVNTMERFVRRGKQGESGASIWMRKCRRVGDGRRA